MPSKAVEKLMVDSQFHVKTFTLGPCSRIATVCTFKWIIVNASSLLEESQRAAIEGDILASSKGQSMTMSGMEGFIVPLHL